MRLCRFDDNRLGIVDGSIVRDVTAALDVVPTQGYPYPTHDVLVEHLDRVLARARVLMPSARTVAVDSITLLSPVANPGKIVAAPVNYEKHRIEASTDPGLHGNHPGSAFNIHSAGLFLKSTSSLVGPGEGVVIRRPDRRTDHEVELVIVVGRKADRVSRADAMQHVAGYAIGLDISIRGSEDRSFRKSPDTYSVLGPWLVTADEIPNWNQLGLWLEVDGKRYQNGSTSTMIFSVPYIVSYLSQFMSLQPGDIIATGTPPGVGMGQKPPTYLKAGSVVRLGVEGLGEQQQRTVAWSK